MGDTGQRIAAFLFGCLFVVAGGGGGVFSIYAVLQGNSSVWILLGLFGVSFAAVGAWLVYLAVVDTDKWADEGRLLSSSFDSGPGWGSE